MSAFDVPISIETNTMTTKFILNVNSKGSVRATSKRVALKSDEVAIAVTLNLPDQMFERPQLNAVLTVPNDDVYPREIDVEVADDIRQAIASVSGLDVHLTLEGDTSDAPKETQ